jgi:signal transduction histidine kinase
VNLPELGRLDDVSALRLEDADNRHGGTLWVGGHGGLLRIDVDAWKATAEPTPTPVLLRGAADAQGDPLALEGGWKLPHDRRGVRLVFAAPSLARDPSLRFESVLDSGSDRTVIVDATPQRDFSALASGDYHLRVRAIGNAGIWSDPLVISFAVQPPWWLSIWAWVGYVLAGFLLVVVAVRERTRELTRRAEVLEGIIAARTEELRKNNLELAHLHKLELDEKTEARLAEAKARLELLRYQLNPHFLMNAFTVLRSLVHAKPDDAANMVGKLADFCRIALTRTDADGGTVDDEAQLIETYLGAEKARWRNELAVAMRVDPAVTRLRIPPFLLQPLVENAIKYGGRTSPLPLRVHISLSPLGTEGVRIEVANTGSWVEADGAERADSTGIGLDNLRQRLSRYYPKAHKLTFSTSDGWVRVVLELTAEPKDPFQRPDGLV